MVEGLEFDLLLLDLALPNKNGWQVLEQLRGQGQQLPIIILSAYHDVKYKVAGLEGGADDYVTKPFCFDELLARIRLQLRKSNLSRIQEEMVLAAGDITLDLRSRQVCVGHRLVELSIKEFTIVEAFLRHPGQVMSREQLLNLVWGYDYEPSSNIVDVYVGYLRKKLGSDTIETIRGIGYRLTARSRSVSVGESPLA